MVEDLGQHPVTACLAPSLAILPAKATFHHATCLIRTVALDVLQTKE